jgi:sulfide dehydrogenase cytochrome subunit
MGVREIAAAALAAALAAGAAAAQDAAPPIAQGCAGCHGQKGEGMGPVVAIAGYDREAFLDVWAAFRANERPATIMNRIARGYTEAEVAELADYFAALR